MRKKDYVLLAEFIRNLELTDGICKHKQKEIIASDLARLLKQDRVEFNVDKFMRATTPKEILL